MGLIIQETLARRETSECEPLVKAFLAQMDWRRVAEAMDIGYAAVRKRWSRCLATLRAEIKKDPQWEELLGEL